MSASRRPSDLGGCEQKAGWWLWALTGWQAFGCWGTSGAMEGWGKVQYWVTHSNKGVLESLVFLSLPHLRELWNHLIIPSSFWTTLDANTIFSLFHFKVKKKNGPHPILPLELRTWPTSVDWWIDWSVELLFLIIPRIRGPPNLKELCEFNKCMFLLSKEFWNSRSALVLPDKDRKYGF